MKVGVNLRATINPKTRMGSEKRANPEV